MMEASTPEIVITSSGETSNSLDNVPRKRKDSNSLPRIKHGSVPHCEYFLHRCLQIMEDKGKTKDSKKLTDLWQRLSALRRHLSCLRCDELCYFDKVVTHPYLFTGNQEILFCENCFKIICKAKTLEHGSSEAKEAFELKKSTRRNINNQNEGNPTNTGNQDCEMSKLATQSTHTITLIDADDSALIAHCFDELENEFTDIPNLKNICRDYLTTCRAIVQLDKYFFPWNDREIVTYQDFRGVSWPYLKKSVDMAHEADPEDPDSEYIYRILKESLAYINKEAIEMRQEMQVDTKVEDWVTEDNTSATGGSKTEMNTPGMIEN